MKDGKYPSWYAKKNGEWVVDEEKANIVREIFRLAADGWSNKEIADKKPALTPIGNRKNASKAWDESTIDWQLKSYNPIGYRKPKNNNGKLELRYKPIVELDVWKKVQELRGARSQGFKRSGIALSRLLYCGYGCYSDSRGFVRPLRFRGKQRTLECYNNTCHFEKISYDDLERMILEHLTNTCAVKVPAIDNSRPTRRLSRLRELSIALHQIIGNVQVANNYVSLTLKKGGRVSDFETADRTNRRSPRRAARP